MLGKHLLDTPDDRRKHGIGDVGYHDADNQRAVRAQAVSGSVRPVVQPFADLVNALGDLRPDEMPGLRVQRAADGRDVDAHLVGDILQRRAATRHLIHSNRCRFSRRHAFDAMTSTRYPKSLGRIARA